MQNYNNPNATYSIPPPPNPYLSQVQYVQQPILYQQYTQTAHATYPPSNINPYSFSTFQSPPPQHHLNPFKRTIPNHNYNQNEPAPKRAKTQEVEPMSAHQFMAKQMQAQNAIPIFNNPYTLHQSIQVQEGNLPMWLDAQIIDLGYDWIQVRYQGFSNNYNKTIYIDPNHAESDKYTIRSLTLSPSNDKPKVEQKNAIIPPIDDRNDMDINIVLNHKSITEQLEELVIAKAKEIKDKKYHSALHDINAFLNRFNPDNIPHNHRNTLGDLYFLYSVCLAQTNAHDEAIEAMKQYIHIRPKSYKGYRTLASYYSFQDKHHDAAKQYEMALKQNMPQDVRRHILATYNNVFPVIKHNDSDDSTQSDENEAIQRNSNNSNNSNDISSTEHESSDDETESDEEEDKPILEAKRDVLVTQNKRGVKGTTLDERVMDTSLMSSAQLSAYKNRVKNPNGFYYRFNLEGEKQKGGRWSDSEHKRFMKRVLAIGVNLEWGFFSKCIEGRVGYQCSNYWRKLLDDEYVADENYVMEDKNGKMKSRQLKRKEIEGAEDDDYFDKFRRFQFTVLQDPSGTFSDVPVMHPKGTNRGTNVSRSKKKHKKRKRKKQQRKKPRIKEKKKRKKRRKKKIIVSEDDENTNNKVKREEKAAAEPADEFLCPISYELMEDPVMVPQSGWTYDREAIKDWIKENGTDPNTRQECQVSDLIPNRTLRDAIARWKQNVGYIKNEA